MTDRERAANRLLDLRELERPGFRELNRRLEAIEREDDALYFHPGKHWEYPWAMERLRAEPGARVLDAGCGASVFPVWLARCGFRVTALDLAPPAGLAERLGEPIEYVSGNLTEMPFPDASFDAVFSISVIEHLGREGIAEAMRELTRVVRPGGQLLITTDYYEDAGAELWHDKNGVRFPVEWSFCDEPQLRELIIGAPGLRLDGALDLAADWDAIRPAMRDFHGYPYTAVGLAFIRR